MPSKDMLERLLKHCLLSGSVVSAILNFIDEAIGSPSEHKQALIALVAGLLVACIVVWLKQKVKN